MVTYLFCHWLASYIHSLQWRLSIRTKRTLIMRCNKSRPTTFLFHPESQLLLPRSGNSRFACSYFIILILQTAHQTTTRPGNFRRIQRQPLIFYGHFDRDRDKIRLRTSNSRACGPHGPIPPIALCFILIYTDLSATRSHLVRKMTLPNLWLVRGNPTRPSLQQNNTASFDRSNGVFCPNKFRT